MKSQPLLDEAAQSDNEDEDWEKWMPDPVDADPGKCSKLRECSGSVVECLRPRLQASLLSLPCDLEQDTLILA